MSASRGRSAAQNVLPGMTRASSRKPRRLVVAPVVREPVLHSQIAATLRLELGPPGKVTPQGVTWWSVDMAGYVGSVPGIRTGRGCIAGVPDLDLIYRGRSYRIELKAKDGRLSDAQCQVATAILSAGAQWGLARSPSEVLELLDIWEIPRARRLRAI
jgi:hypothetical protein